MSATGLYGKLPAHGDFIDRQLPRSFISVWDEWMQCAVAGSRELLASHWLDHYLTSPIWRFGLMPGVLDKHTWLGVLVPSVDSVGRYFPLTIACPVSSEINLFRFFYEAEAWFSGLEDVAVSALNSQLRADDLLEQLNSMADPGLFLSDSATATRLKHGGLRVDGGNYADQVMSFMAVNHETLGSYSLWQCGGDSDGSGSLLVRTGLPSPEEYCGMIGGKWY